MFGDVGGDMCSYVQNIHKRKQMYINIYVFTNMQTSIDMM